MYSQIPKRWDPKWSLVFKMEKRMLEVEAFFRKPKAIWKETREGHSGFRLVFRWPFRVPPVWERAEPTFAILLMNTHYWVRDAEVWYYRQQRPTRMKRDLWKGRKEKKNWNGSKRDQDTRACLSSKQRCVLQCVAVCVAVCQKCVCGAVCASSLSNEWFSSPAVNCSVVCRNVMQCVAMCVEVYVADCGSVCCSGFHSLCCSVSKQSVKWVILVAGSVLQCVVLQNVAVCCNVFQCALQHVLKCAAVCVAVCCSMLRCVAVCFNVPYRMRCSVRQCVLRCASQRVLQYEWAVCQMSDSPRSECVAVYGVAVCCNVLQRALQHVL